LKFTTIWGLKLTLDADIFFDAGVLLLLLGISGFFSGAKTAFFTLKTSVIENFKNSDANNERRVAYLLSNSRQLFTTIISGNAIAGISFVVLSTLWTINLAESLRFNTDLAVLIEVVAVSLAMLLIDEILFKVFALRNPEAYAKVAGGPLLSLFYVLSPLTIFLVKLTRLAHKIMGITSDKTQMSEEELKSLVMSGEEKGVLEDEEKEMIHSIIEFSETTVKEIMVPRTDMVCVEVNMTLSELIEIIKDRMLSRIPVYEGRIDNIIGILYVKDLLPLLIKSKNVKIDFRKLAREPYFVPEQKMIDDLLRQFQQDRQHMALVVDEYGGISGLVTLEDVIEEIVGEIQDEYDKETPLITEINENTFLVDGRINLEELNETLHLDLPTEEGVETISGFILNLLGALPREKERAEYNGYQFVVEEIDRNRILMVRIEKNVLNQNLENEAVD